jgi:hypothetical protein
MPNYSFETLSPYDLEVLTRDLVQAELGIRLENFAHGRDRGIDLRYAKDRLNTIIVQCKHYARSSWAELRRALQTDVPKIQALAPRRYIVVTSLPMTPDRKDWVCKAFAPYCQSAVDVLGVEDLNNLLGRHPEIERQHYKLWLTSVPILERILHSDVFADQSSEVEHIRRRISRFVSNASVGRAREILSKHHFCVITGVPGIGKTTLAEMLVIDHLDRGFECFRVWDDIGDARKVFGTGRNQLFYYDDFLGRTGLRQPDKNEDERLLRFIRDVVQSNHHRLLLTSRDYILNQARSLLEGLTRADLDPARCVVSLADYTPQIRAEILYNHLYHSGIPQEHISALLNIRAYRTIVRHRNYSPRIVEAMTDILNVRDIHAEAYPTAFLANLDNPRKLWEVAYGSHLTNAAQNALLVVASLADQIRIKDAEQAFEAFHRPRADLYHQPSTPYDWKRALKELEGTFIAIGPSHGDITIRFHNPSVRDFIENHLKENLTDAVELIVSAVFPDQITRIQRILGDTTDRSWIPHSLRRFLEIFDRPSSIAVLGRFGTGQTVWRTRVESPIARFMAFSQIAALAAPQNMAEFFSAAIRYVLDYLQTAVPNRAELTTLLEAILEGSIPLVSRTDDLYLTAHAKAYEALDSHRIDLDEFDALVDFADKHLDEVNDEIRERLTKEFGRIADQEFDVIDQYDSDVRLAVYDQLEDIAERLGVALPISRDVIMETIEYLPDEEDHSRLGTGERSGGGMSDGDLDSMFESLRR